MNIEELSEQREIDIALLQTYPSEKRLSVGSQLYPSLIHPSFTQRLRGVARDFHLDYSEHRSGWKYFCESLRVGGKEKAYNFFRTLLGKRKNEKENFFPYSNELAGFLTRFTFIRWYDPLISVDDRDIKPIIEEHLDGLYHPRAGLLVISEQLELSKFLNKVEMSITSKQRRKMNDETGGHIYLEDFSYHSQNMTYYRDQQHAAMDFLQSFLGQMVSIALGCTQSSRFWQDNEVRLTQVWNPYNGNMCLTPVKQNTHYFDMPTYGDCRACVNYLIAKNKSTFKKSWPKSPFLPLIDIYEKGYVPLGVFGGKYLIFQPPVLKGKSQA